MALLGGRRGTRPAVVDARSPKLLPNTIACCHNGFKTLANDTMYSIDV